MRWICYVVFIEIRNASRVLVRKSEGKRPFGKPRHRWEINRRGGYGLDSFDLGQRSVADSCEHSTEPSSSAKGGEFD
jgi:hypothetical protein